MNAELEELEKCRPLLHFSFPYIFESLWSNLAKFIKTERKLLWTRDFDYKNCTKLCVSVPVLFWDLTWCQRHLKEFSLKRFGVCTTGFSVFVSILVLHSTFFETPSLKLRCKRQPCDLEPCDLDACDLRLTEHLIFMEIVCREDQNLIALPDALQSKAWIPGSWWSWRPSEIVDERRWKPQEHKTIA